MGSAESVPSRQPSARVVKSSSADKSEFATLQEKFDSFRLTPNEQLNEAPAGRDRRDAIVSASKTDAWVRQVLEDPKNRLALSALSTNNPAAVLQKPSTVIRDTQVYNVSIPFEGGPVTNQRSSGRCWLFASTNVFRVAIMKKYALDQFECSQSYLFFWDKVEKANFFLENILETADEPTSGRIVSTLMASPVGDGGQWDMVVNLVEKYGLVPQALYPDSWNAMNSSFMDRLLTTKLREDALRLRAMKTSGSATAATSIAAAKDAMMEEIVRILTLSLGPPPSASEKFTWEFLDKNKQYRKVRLSPLDFAASLHDSHALRACGGTDVHKLFSLVNDPRNEYNSLLTVNRLGNVWGGRPVTYVNVDKTVLKKACVEMLKKGWPVFFGSDVGQTSDSSKGIMDNELYDYELGYNVRLGLSKAQRLMTGESAMTHAMVLTAVHLSPSGEPLRWRVQNSWSSSAGSDGYFVMSDRWMDEFCYQAVVDPSVVSAETRKVLEQTPKTLELWDPMGALA